MSSNPGYARNLFQHVLQTSPEPFDPARLRQIEAHLDQLPLPAQVARVSGSPHAAAGRTIALVPPPRSTGRILELGCYMQITPFLQRLCHYQEVRGAY